MAKIDLYNMKGDKTGEIEISDAIFAVEPNEDLLHRAVVIQLGNKRQGTHQAKTRAEVRGGGRKPFRQKGTGRARQGSTRAPIQVGGGVSFGPRPRSYRKKLSKKMRRQALKSALTVCLRDERLRVLDELKLDEIKTKELVKVLHNLELNSSALLVLEAKDKVVEKSGSNIPGLSVEYINTLNVYDLLKHENVVMTEASVRKLEEVYA